MLNLKILKFTFLFSFLLLLSACHKKSQNNYDPLVLPSITLVPNQYDNDEDYLPNTIEKQQKSNLFDDDENNNGIKDGLEGDTFFAYQWYIYNPQSQNICNTANISTIEGIDLGILPMYHYTLGDTNHTQTIQVVDGGVDLGHEDLVIDLNRSINSMGIGSDPTPTEGFSSIPAQVFFRGHGTAVAGIIAGIGFNNLGIRGIIPTAKIAGSNWLESEDLEKLEEVWLNGTGAEEITISNNSWGTKILDDKTYEIIMEEASKTLRGGKGRIFVFAGGNERKEFSNANLSYLLNNPYAIAVSALNHENHYASYSTGGSNILVSAYGGEHYYTAPTIMTTFTPNHAMSQEELNSQKGPITLDEDTNKDYTYAMNGSSASAPMVSGAIALVLDLCPSLTWRDIRWLIAYTAIKIDPHDKEWIENARGFYHNNNYGFGKINPLGMSEICLSPEYTLLPKQEHITKIHTMEETILDNNTTLSKTLSIDKNLQIEWLGLTLEIDHDYAGDIEIALISPRGTISHIMQNNFLTFNAYKEGFRFATVSLMAEMSKGEWRIEIRDSLEDDVGTLKSIKLEIKGHQP